MKKVIFSLLVCSPFLFGYNHTNLYDAYTNGYDFAFQKKQKDVLKYKKYCINKYYNNNDMAIFCTLGAISWKTGEQKLSYQKFLKRIGSK